MRLLLISIFTLILLNRAEGVKPSSLFTDHTVLQKGVSVPVWGTAKEGESVSVSFNGQTVTTKAVNGRWLVRLKPMDYLTEPASMTIAGSDTVIIKDVLVGEVWICSGQSNMERQLGPRPPQPLITDWEKERDAADYPLIREYYVPLNYSKDRIDDVNSRWTVCSPQSVSDFTAVGYFFAKNLFRSLKVPVGIIFSAFGGTPVEDWMSKEALTDNPDFRYLVDGYAETMKGWHPDGKVMNGLYNGMVNPLVPYSVKGVAWYQGEQNNDRAEQYAPLLEGLIADWRSNFNNPKMPFLIVQVAPFKDLRPELREAQLMVSQKVKRTALIVTTDCGNANDIHPSHKQPVGERLSLAALKIAYGKDVVCSGPLFRKHKVRNGRMIVRFTDIGSGLATSDNGPLTGFTIAGADGKFYPAKASIEGDNVVVYSAEVPEPVSLRYGWANVPIVNLCNKEGLPASPFRTGK